MKTAMLIANVMGMGLLAVAASAQEGKIEETSAKVKALQQERIAALENLADITNRLFQNARTRPDVAYDARLLLLKAQVNAAVNESDRVKLYENFVEAMKSFEERAIAMKQGAQGTEINVLKSKAMRLEGEIALEQAKAGVEKKVGAKKVEELRQERLAALKKLADVTNALYRNARTTADVACEAKWILMKAEAEVAGNDSDRIKLYVNFVEVMKEYEAMAETQKVGVQGSLATVLKANAMRVEGEIMLARARASGDKDEEVKGLKELQQTRIALLKELADVTKALYQNARTTAEEAHEAALALLKAEAEVAGNESDRVKLYENFVEVMKHFEERAKSLKLGAQGTEAEVQRARAARLEGEIALEQAKARATK